MTPSSFTYDNIVVKPEFKDRTEEQSIFVVSLGGEQTFDDWSVDYTLAFSEAEQYTPSDKEVLYESIGNSTATVSGYNNYIFNLGSATAGTNFSDPANYAIDALTDGNQLVTETDISGKLNLKREFDQERLKYIKFGGLLRNKEKDNDAEADLIDPFDDAFANFLNPNVRNPYGSPIPSLSASILNDANLNESTRARILQDSVEEDYETTENVFAAYFMSSFDLGEWNLIAGARLEHTDFETDGFNYDEGNDTFTGASFDKDYTNLLPGIHLRRNIGESGVFRASWTNTIARPTFEQSAPRVTRDGTDVSRGNPNLDPYEAMNLDASFQYYSEDHGVFSVALFYKDIENFIYEQEFTEGPDTVVSFRNGDSGDILGLELSYSKQFTELPGALSGLSLSSNLTLTDSEADAERETAGSVTTSFLKQSDVIGNVSLAWEWDRYFIRLSGTYRDDYLDSLGDDADGLDDRYVDDFLQVDLYSSVQLHKGLSLFLEVNNLTNEPFRAYFGGANRLSQFEEYGVSGAIGAKWQF